VEIMVRAKPLTAQHHRAAVDHLARDSLVLAGRFTDLRPAPHPSNQSVIGTFAPHIKMRSTVQHLPPTRPSLGEHRNLCRGVMPEIVHLHANAVGAGREAGNARWSARRPQCLVTLITAESCGLAATAVSETIPHSSRLNSAPTTIFGSETFGTIEPKANSGICHSTTDWQTEYAITPASIISPYPDGQSLPCRRANAMV